MENRERLFQLVEGALGQPDEFREQWLLDACDGDAGLYKKVWELVEADAIETRAFELELPKPSDDNLVGTIIGVWKLIRLLGKGGMGTVWLAERHDGEVRMSAAVKVIKKVTESSELLNRFRRERQIMADLHHPHIGMLFDAGTTDDGRPYLVMEYVDGDVIDRYCDQHQLSRLERVRLFRQVCDAVRFAHRRGVIHRDIKPPNIMVTSEGLVKLMDFGIAHLSSDSETGLTRTGQKIMTPEYASPEQRMGKVASVASDIYSLALVLCYLVTGQRPRLLGSHPSNKVKDVFLRRGQSSHQSTNSSVLIDILIKALDPDQSKRYESVEAMIKDLQSFLNEAPSNGDDSEVIRHRYDATIWCDDDSRDESEKLAYLLEKTHDLKLWLVWRQTEPGETPTQAYARALSESGCLLVCTSGKWPWLDEEVRHELEHTIENQRVIPVLLKDALPPNRESELPAFLRRRAWARIAHVSDPVDLERLACAIRGQRMEITKFEPTETCPFKGLEAFTEEDAHFFFGRGAIIQRLNEHINQHRFLAVLGPSGSGKSSVVQAGLLPKLREQGFIPTLLTPASHPLIELAYALFKLWPDEQTRENPEVMLQRLKAGDEALYFILREIRESGAGSICLVVDQFEFMTKPSKRQCLITLGLLKKKQK